MSEDKELSDAELAEQVKEEVLEASFVDEGILNAWKSLPEHMQTALSFPEYYRFYRNTLHTRFLEAEKEMKTERANGGGSVNKYRMKKHVFETVVRWMT